MNSTDFIEDDFIEFLGLDLSLKTVDTVGIILAVLLLIICVILFVTFYKVNNNCIEPYEIRMKKIANCCPENWTFIIFTIISILLFSFSGLWFAYVGIKFLSMKYKNKVGSRAIILVILGELGILLACLVLYVPAILTCKKYERTVREDSLKSHVPT